MHTPETFLNPARKNSWPVCRFADDRDQRGGIPLTIQTAIVPTPSSRARQRIGLPGVYSAIYAADGGTHLRAAASGRFTLLGRQLPLPFTDGQMVKIRV